MSERGVVFMYSGQGAQYYQMGRELFEHEPAFRAVLEQADRLLGALLGRSMIEEMFSRPMSESDRFDRLLFTHPLLVSISHGVAQVLKARGVRPSAVLGYSLGEISAAIEASVLSFEAGLRLVVAQAEEAERLTEPGRMVAILDSPTRLYQWPEVFAGCHLAAANHGRHFVVSVAEGRAASLLGMLERLSVPHVVLPIQRGFHSPLVDPLRALASHPAARIPYQQPRLPLISCQLTTRVDDFHALHLWRVVREPVLFEDTVRNLAREGEWTWIDVGPAGTLASFVRQILGPSARVFPAITQFGDNLRTIDRIVESLQ